MNFSKLRIKRLFFVGFWGAVLCLFQAYNIYFSLDFLCLRRVRDAEEILVVYPSSPIFIKVSAPALELGDMPKELKEVLGWLEDYLRKQGFGFAFDYLAPDKVLMFLEDGASIYSKELPDLLAESQAGKWTIIFQQLTLHGRDLQIEFATRDTLTGELKVITMVIKGAGRGGGSTYISGLLAGMNTIYQRPFYVRVPKILKDYSLGRKEIERLYAEETEKTRFNTWAFIGGMDYEYAVAEYKRALAIHRLLFELDGKPAGIPLYTGINLLTEIPVVKDGEVVMVKTEEFLTRPDILTWKELLAVAYELREKVKRYSEDLELVEAYIDLLWSDNYPYTIEYNPRLMERIRNIVKREMLLATLTKWEVSNFRLCDWRRDDENILEYLRLIYGVNEWNEHSAHEVVERFTFSIARTLGAIHGAGGCLSNGTETTSSVVSKDISLNGEMQDLMDSAYIPFFGADPEVPGIKLVEWQTDDRGYALQCIKEFCDKLYFALANYGLLDYPDFLNNLYNIYRRIFHEAYWEYYQRAQEFKKGLAPSF